MNKKTLGFILISPAVLIGLVIISAISYEIAKQHLFGFSVFIITMMTVLGLLLINE